jgi:glycosyltransferase involved in cell wall biosynthesis
MKLLFITQKLHGQDAFAVLWVNEFRKRGYEVTVLCLEKNLEGAKHVLGEHADLSFEIVSMGKELGRTKIEIIREFYKQIRTLKYDRVFIHMTPVWGAFGAPVWIMRKTPVYLWYTHYKMQPGLLMLGWYGKRLFCATPQSLPQYPSTSSGQAKAKKVVVGHGIDLAFWPKRANHAIDHKNLLIVHRLSRSKRVEIILRALQMLPGYTLDIYGVEAEKDYATELKKLAHELGVGPRVKWKGTIAVKELASIYADHHLILNMASETIDKTMLEAMTCGCYPMTTDANAAAIGITEGVSDSPESIVAFIDRYGTRPPMSADQMYSVVKERHSLESLVTKMDSYIRSGT